jgi:hypothetical protein
LCLNLAGANFGRQYIQESIGEEAAGKAAASGIAAGEKISRNTLEKEARPLKVHGTAEQKFWQRQPSQAETIAVGKQYIAKVSSPCWLKSKTDPSRPPPTRRKRRRRNCKFDKQKGGIRHSTHLLGRGIGVTGNSGEAYRKYSSQPIYRPIWDE